MTKDQVTYVVFGVVLLVALIFDLGLLSKKNHKVSIKQALYQTFFWCTLALAFFVFIWAEKGRTLALQYISAYLMEWSLSIDNIFVFILIFTSFNVREKNYGRVLLIGILVAIVLRIVFITVGVALIRFDWILLVFGAFLVYTGYKMFTANEDADFEPHNTRIYRFLQKVVPLTPHDGNGKFSIKEGGKRKYTTLFIVVVMLAAIDLVFALDSLPAVLGISTDKLVVYTSNIFAVLGLRSLFFLLRGAVSKFDYLQQGISIVLVFIGLKMLGEHWINQWLDNETQVLISLGVILICIAGSILYSSIKGKKRKPADENNENIQK